ncbi:hypothetical protein K402DRAFT_328660 [Aulographum hederae CBS 113979]|uniref:GID complex catalytic subunit 2 n=1 Tax=Aulographum hederae CBS 113979 TaxID=1176131 RepID=A0A6G1H606_9PEZI|nr:hypothetical protein K402DRAFT_328660 [Aulographum hederae CBS 113979]
MPRAGGPIDLFRELEELSRRGSLEKSVDDVQKAIDMLVSARANIESSMSPLPYLQPISNLPSGPANATMTLARLQTPLKKSFDSINEDLTEVHRANSSFTKAVDRKLDKPLSTTSTDAVTAHPSLINRAIAMHLLRAGQFGVASTFIGEANASPPVPTTAPNTPNPYMQQAWEQDFAEGTLKSESLQRQFSEMYYILHGLREARNLSPAIEWARGNSRILEARGSNLEFELCMMQFICLFSEDNPIEGAGPLRAWAYARSSFPVFSSRYTREINQLMGALAFWENIPDSPYAQLFTNDTAWENVATSFTREFCSLLGLSAESPLFLATTAGAVALPVLDKYLKITKEKKTEWTSIGELPVETPLPPAYHFHSIFVCPVSKEQATDMDPPMMMPCGHVICKQSLETYSKGARFKCPYCPSESHPRDAKRIYL